MRSLRTKLVLIMVLLILALMTVVGSFLINGVSQFYTDEFYSQMEQTFSTEFLIELQDTAAENNAPARLKELVMAQADLSIDMTTRNVYILDETGTYLDGSADNAGLEMTTNLLAAMRGEVGQETSPVTSYMDLAIPIDGGDATYIVYIRDNKATVNALTSDVLQIILRALVLGLVICIVLAVVLSQILLTPIKTLSDGTRQVAAGDFSQKLEVTSHDEIGMLTRSFNNMSTVLQNTISEVENERAKLSALFLHMTDGVIAFNAAGNLIHYNPAAVEMLGRNLDPAVCYDELFAQDAKFSDVLALRRPQFLDLEKRVGDRDLELFLAPFAKDQDLFGALVLIHDVTEQRKSEELRREFVANVSHELRTPLTNIKSYAETIMDSGDELPAELRNNFLGVINNEADRMTRIVQDLLTLSRFDYGKMEMHFSRFPFSKAVRDVYEAIEVNAQQNHGHRMSLDMPDTLPEVSGDCERIEQVIMNIISNAVKYTPNGGRIAISAGTEGHMVWVKVSDNGIGIPEQDLPRLFERFYRVDKARSRESGGTGLGLSIAREILNLHKGDIRIESVYGQGTDVTILLPVAE